MLQLYEKLRNKLYPKRLYKYGTFGLDVHDDRNKIEKILDTIEIYIRRIDDYFKHKKYMSRNIWNSYFDTSTGQIITSYAQIKKIEKKMGYTYTTYREMEDNAKKYKKIRKDEHDKKSREEIKKKLYEVRQGRSFATELIDKASKEDKIVKANRLKADKYRRDNP